MHRIALLIILAGIAAAQTFSGQRALDYTGKAVSFGPRHPNSPASARLREWLKQRLKPTGCRIIEDRFTASTPRGAVPMENVIAHFPGTSGKSIVISGHYDTKIIPGVNFLGANDGGSSTGFLLELANALAKRPRQDDIYVVWFDGEESFEEWSDTDSLYGSRHLVDRWRADGQLTRVKALINIDMIGDRDLLILHEGTSTRWLRDLIWRNAGPKFSPERMGVVDDHTPFLRAGVPACDLIDFSFGPSNSWWHTAEDTMDKLSAASFEAVADAVLKAIPELERR